MHDIVIVGGGLAGLALLNSLDKQNNKVLLLDDSSGKQPSSRPLVLTADNAAWLNYQHGFPITEVKVSMQNRFGVLQLQAKEHGLSNFAYVVDALALQKKLYDINKQYIQKSKVATVSEQTAAVIIELADTSVIKAKKLVAADGARSSINQQLNFPKVNTGSLAVAITPNVELLKSTPAQLRFVKSGTLAYLPVSERSGTIVATGAAVNKNLYDLWSKHLLISSMGEAISYEQDCFYLTKFHSNRVVFVGNAAHNLAPVGAQGFNLACKNIAELATNLDVINYADVSMPRTKTTFNACDFLARSDVSGYLGLGALGLRLIANSFGLQSELVAKAMQK